MSFDVQITSAFETLTERLRGEIDREVSRRTAELSAAAAAELAAATPDLPSIDSTDGASIARLALARGFDAIDATRSLTGVLDTLLAFATEDAPDASIWLIRGGRPYRWRAPGSGHTDDDTRQSLDAGIPLTIGGQTVAVLLTNAELRTENSELEPTNDERRTTNVALVARYAARALESLTAFTAARALTRQPDAPAAGAADGAASEEDVSARRYARLLVSEIKLYHEPAVIDGRRDRDLATRLGGEIARARVMYDERVPPHVRARSDYFHDELVKTLANGDASLLDRGIQNSELGTST
jgi:hypothetical protein